MSIFSGKVRKETNSNTIMSWTKNSTFLSLYSRYSIITAGTGSILSRRGPSRFPVFPKISEIYDPCYQLKRRHLLCAYTGQVEFSRTHRWLCDTLPGRSDMDSLSHNKQLSIFQICIYLRLYFFIHSLLRSFLFWSTLPLKKNNSHTCLYLLKGKYVRFLLVCMWLDT